MVSLSALRPLKIFIVLVVIWNSREYQERWFFSEVHIHLVGGIVVLLEEKWENCIDCCMHCSPIIFYFFKTKTRSNEWGLIGLHQL
jgi:hypothetical protein